ncbi:protein SAAL1 [Monomorium pharaonis]|uniref:protein SAAL1 n=1 Tax=Monomorium pharaonis TaxID=307658 RepID=UPI00063F2E1C|nr:protein SAAL1 [Monomorium pharaonis]
MIDSQDVSEEELKVLKGDAVGNSLCSSSWIIKTLMSLSQIDEHGWTEELEDQLCTLWDLSMEGEVVSHLMLYDFPKIAKTVLMTSNEPRLTEIILGIIGNVCCNDEAIDTIGSDRELAKQILCYLVSSDSLILIQLIRILQLVVWKIRQNPQSDWMAHFMECQFFGHCISFMLKSSTIDNLLIAVMNLLESLSQTSLPSENNLLEKLFKINDLVPALLESFQQVIPVEKSSYSELTFVQHWLAVLIAIMKSGSLKFENCENDERLSKLMEIMYRILRPCRKIYNLYPIRQSRANMICDAVRVLLGFRRCDVNVPPKIDCIIAIMMFSLKTESNPPKEGERAQEKSREELDPEKLIPDLLDYLHKYWLQITELCTSEQIAEIFCLCDCKVRESLMSLMCVPEFKVTPEVLDKVKKAAAAAAVEKC